MAALAIFTAHAVSAARTSRLQAQRRKQGVVQAMKTRTQSNARTAPDFAALLPALAGHIADTAAHYRETATAEDIHAIRVATRRVRAALKLPANADRDGAEALSDEAKWLADSVGTARDADVLLETVSRMIERRQKKFGDTLKPLQQAMTNSANLAMGGAKRSLGSRRFNAFVRSLRAFPKAPPSSKDDSGTDQGQVSPLKKLSRDHRKLQSAAKRAFKTGRQEDFHRMRISAKKTRYALEAISDGPDGVGAKPLAAFRDLQDLLGEAHDLHMASARVTELAERNRAKWDSATLTSTETLDGMLLRRAGKLEKKAPGVYREISGKRWEKHVRKLKKAGR